MSKKVLITGATGNIASLVIPQLIEKGIDVRAFVHNASKAEKLKAEGVEIVEGDFSSAEKLNEAIKGVDVVLSITPPAADAFAQAAAITKAAKENGVKHLIRISAIGAAENAPTDNGRIHHKTDEDIIASGIPYTILRPNFYMQNVFMSVPTILEQGNMYWGMGEGNLSMIDVRDVADACVSLIVNGGHENKIYQPNGPASINFTQIAKIISDGIGKPVNYVAVPAEAVSEAIKKAGMGDWFAGIMTDYSRAYSKGWGDLKNNDFETITGKKSRSFQQFFDEVMTYGFKQTV